MRHWNNVKSKIQVIWNGMVKRWMVYTTGGTDMNKIEIKENQVFKPNKSYEKFRRVYSVFDNDVYYSTGSDRNNVCKISTFIVWIKTSNACIVLPE